MLAVCYKISLDLCCYPVVSLLLLNIAFVTNISQQEVNDVSDLLEDEGEMNLRGGS